MKRLFVFLFLLLSFVRANAVNPSIREIDINVTIDKAGTARITEIWDVCVASGTEWYLTKYNLGNMQVGDLSVSDENGTYFINEGRWSVDRTITQKAGRCGIVPKNDGCEICWGVGEYGDHTYTVSYTLTNLVKSLNDCDLIQYQFVSPGLSSKPEHVRLVISGPVQFNTENCGIWGFGFNGTIDFLGGHVVAESNEQFRSGSSVIALVRFNKGIFNSSDIVDMSFEQVWDDASEGSDYFIEENGEKEHGSFIARIFSFLYSLFQILIFALIPVLAIFGAKNVSKRQKRNILGVNPEDVTWSREVPFDGNILEADYVLTKLGEDKRQASIASAMILRMLKEGALILKHDGEDTVDILFNDNADFSRFPKSCIRLYSMMKKASGSDRILQNKEFSRWSRRNMDEVVSWIEQVNSESAGMLSGDGYVIAGRFTQDGQKQARGVLGFRKFLEDFTLIDERRSAEVGLWQEYLIFGALYGIADKVSKELRDINPQIYEQIMPYDYDTMRTIIYMSRNMATAITSANNAAAAKAAAAAAAAQRVGGGGGFTSFGGGGHFSGGGFGGGSR